IKLSSNNLFSYLITSKLLQQQELVFAKIYPQCSTAGRDNFISLTVNIPKLGQIFVKQLHHSAEVIKNKIKNELLFYEFLASCSNLIDLSSLLLELLYFDKINSIVIYQCPENYLNLESHYIENKGFSTKISELMGNTLANLHRETLNSQECYHFMNQTIEGELCYQFPYPDYLLDRLYPEAWLQEIHFQGNGFIATYQGSKTLIMAVKELVTNHHHRCITHNNLQFNNIYISQYWLDNLEQAHNFNKSIIRLSNWEKCSWGDPAFDLGTVIAGYLLLWLESIIIHPDIKLEQSLHLALVPLESLQPSLVVFIRSYLGKYPEIIQEVPDLLRRVVQFTGLALIYKVIAIIQSFYGFDARCHAILKVARKLLCSPETSFRSVFGIKESELLEKVVVKI
ncbi:hypothetical protein, partial [Moorena sp. SIO3F7]